MLKQPRQARRTIAGIAALALVVAVLVAIFGSSGPGKKDIFDRDRFARIDDRGTGLYAALGTTGPVAPSGAATDKKTTPSHAASATPVQAVAASPTPAPVPPARVVEAANLTPQGPSIDAYKGLGSWVDIYEDKAWANPDGVVRDMKSHGVHTLFIETSNSRAKFEIRQPATMATFIRTAHANGMKVVAWYLPDLKSVSWDFGRIRSAMRFRTSDGQSFDSFALDIESEAVSSPSARTAALRDLSGRIRGLMGPSYPLGAIIPSPTALNRKNGVWDGFPYQMLAQTYNAFVPMSYYTYHGKGNVAAYNDTVSNVRILRGQKGCANTPIHLIGGIAESSTPSELKAFLRAEHDTKSFGASLYSWSGTNKDHWKQLEELRP